MARFGSPRGRPAPHRPATRSSRGDPPGGDPGGGRRAGRPFFFPRRLFFLLWPRTRLPRRPLPSRRLPLPHAAAFPFGGPVDLRNDLAGLAFGEPLTPFPRMRLLPSQPGSPTRPSADLRLRGDHRLGRQAPGAGTDPTLLLSRGQVLPLPGPRRPGRTAAAGNLPVRTKSGAGPVPTLPEEEPGPGRGRGKNPGLWLGRPPAPDEPARQSRAGSPGRRTPG